MGKKIDKSTLAAETMSADEAIEWGLYIKEVWEEINKDCECEVILITYNRSVKEALEFPYGAKNRMLRIDLASLKEKVELGNISDIRWIESRQQLADGITKDQGTREMSRESIQ